MGAAQQERSPLGFSVTVKVPQIQFIAESCRTTETLYAQFKLCSWLRWCRYGGGGGDERGFSAIGRFSRSSR